MHKKKVISNYDIRQSEHKQSLFRELTHVFDKKVKETGLNAEEKNESSPWSNAFNFSKSWGTEVDPRTGVLAAYFKAGNMLSNIGHGPNINLQINYNSGSTANPDGLGTGWNWNLTHFDLITGQIFMSNGQSFYLKQSSKNHWHPLYHKLNDFEISGDKSTHFIITYANGSREILSHEGYETRLEQQNGWGVNFIYQHGTHLLQSILDDEGNSIILAREQSHLNIISRESDGRPAVIRIENHNGNINKIIFLSAHDSDSQIINLYYKNNRLSQVIYPTGLEKTFTFDCDDAMKLPLQSESGRPLCVVSAETLKPDAGKLMKISYAYSQTDTNEHNYLGFNSGLTAAREEKKDILFEAPVDYTYHTMTDNGLLKEIHTYSKYHLLINSKLISDRTGHLLSETENFFCNTKSRDGCSQTSFEKLPPTYSLPLKVITKIWGTSSNKPAVTTESREYDNFGRVTSSKDSYGRVTRTRYCPLNGDAACPAIPKGWLFTLLPESVTFYPAPMVTQAGIPVTILSYYRKEPNLNGKGYVLIPNRQTKQARSQSITMTYHYYDNPNDAFTYGLTKQIILTGTTENSLSSEPVIYDYYYTKSADGYRKIFRDAVELGQGKKQFHSTVITSLFTNKVLARTDAAGKNTTNYHYDIFGRLIQKDLAAGTPFASTEHYQHLFSPGHNQVIITAANGLQNKIIFDNAGHELMRFSEAISASGEVQPGHWQLKKLLRYDAYGRATEQIFYMTGSSNEIQTLKTTKDYDEMGRVSHVYLPDGETIFMLYDNKDRCVASYRQNAQGKRSAIAIVLGNVLNKPIEKRLIPAFDGEFIPLKTLCSQQHIIPAKISTITYDGFGRIIKKTDPMGRTVYNQYNALGHLNDITDPAGNRIHQVYNLNGQIIQRWAIPARGGRYLLSSAGYNAGGQLLFKAGEDGKKTTFTYTKNGLPDTVTTPAGHTFSWQYNLLGLPVTSYVDNKVLIQNDYDSLTHKLIKKTDITGITTWNYGADGLPQKLVHTGQSSYPNYTLRWYYDNDRRNIGNTDISGNITQVKYDKFARVSTLNYIPVNGSAKTLYTATYDDFSRMSHIDYGSGMQKEIHYDHFGRQSEVTDTLSNRLISRWKFDYDTDDNIVTLTQQAGNNQYAVLNYQYDVLDNLTSMHCQGSSGLPLCPRDTEFKDADLKSAPIITRQNYTFTPLNRIARVSETLQNADTEKTLSKVMVYGYNNTNAPLRLQQISTAWNQNTPIMQQFTYDISGNMSTDGEGNHIFYNAFNQIIQTIQSNGKQSSYVYDGGGRKVMEETMTTRRYLFYRAKQLINEKIFAEKEKAHTIGYQGMVRTIDNIIHEYEERNYKGDVVGILTKKASESDKYILNQRNIYSPYGMVWHGMQTPLPFYLRNLIGFDGQRADPATGWQFLGAGHRTYNPQQRYFVSEDPLGDGYAFASNNPIMRTDPTGNTSVYKIMGYIGTLGLGAINSAGALAGSLIMLTLSGVVAIASLLYNPGALAPLIFVAEVAGIATLPVVDGIIRNSKSLNARKSFHRITSFLSVAQLAITSVVGAVVLGPRIFRALSSVAGSLTSRVATAGSRAGYEAIELESLSESEAASARSGEPLTSLGRMLQNEHSYLFTQESFGDAIKFRYPDDVTCVQATLQLHDEDIGAVLGAASLEEKPLNIAKLETLLSAKENINSNLAAYHMAFIDLMSDFATPHSAISATITSDDLFPGRVSFAAVVNGARARLVRKIGTKYQAILFKTTGIRTYKGNIGTILDGFMNDDGTLSVDLYFHFDR